MDENREIFRRQRRNLLVMSVVILLYYYLGLEPKTINILGNQAELSSSDRVDVVLWIFLFYWFVRYSQYLHYVDTSDYGTRFRNKQQGYLIQKIRKSPPPFETILTKAQKTLSHPMDESRKINIEFRALQDDRRYGLFKIETVCRYGLTSGNRNEYVDIAQSFGLKELWLINAKLFIYFCTRTPYFTEYALPYVMSIGTALLVFYEAI